MTASGRRRAAALALAALAAGAGWWWWPAGDGQAASAAAHAAARSGPDAGSAPGARSPGAAAMRAGATAPARADTPADDPLLSAGLRDAIEALLHEAGEAPDPTALKQRLAGLVGRHFPPELATRAHALALRYVDYRVALGSLRPPRDPGDPLVLRQALDQRRALRQQHFDGDEYQALFGAEEALDRLALARAEAQRNPALSAAERAAIVAAAEAELPEAQRAERARSTEHLAAAAQTAAFDAQGADAWTRHAARSAQYGEAAAHALARLDREENEWQDRLGQYAQARAQAQGSDTATLATLRQRLFSPEEQLRLDAALALRAARQDTAPAR